MSGKAKTLPDETNVSARAVDLQRVATRKRISRGSVSTERYVTGKQRSESIRGAANQ